MSDVAAPVPGEDLAPRSSAATPDVIRRSWGAALDGHRLLVTGFGLWGGGLYDLTEGLVHTYDDLASTGLVVDGDRLWRVLRANGELTGGGELVCYDDGGVLSYQRLDTVRDPQDVCVHDGEVHIASAWDNAVWRIPAGGRPERVWHPSTMPDSWHPAGLCSARGSLFVSLFGRNHRYRGWSEQRPTQAGVLHDLTRNRDVVGGLGQPHSPHLDGDRWYLCESSLGAITELTVTGVPTRRLGLSRYTRGLAITPTHLFVGLNAGKVVNGDERAELIVVDRERFEVVDRLALPSLEVHDVRLVPESLARGARLGFANAPARVVDQHLRTRRPDAQLPAPRPARVSLASNAQAALIGDLGQPVDEGVLQGQVDVHLPDRLPADTDLTVTAAVWNQSSIPFATVPPHRICVTPRWYRLEGDREGDPEIGVDSPIPRIIEPGGWDTMDVVVQTPKEPGRYRLAVTLQQVGVRWFGIRRDCLVEIDPS